MSRHFFNSIRRFAGIRRFGAKTLWSRFEHPAATDHRALDRNLDQAERIFV
jgi:hypothetical protein